MPCFQASLCAYGRRYRKKRQRRQRMIVDLVTAARKEDWDRTRQLLYHHWINECPKLFTPSSEHPWEATADETTLNKTLFTPLASVFCVDSSIREPTLRPLNEQAGTTPEMRRAGQICGYVFKSGEITYTCKQCATDPTCVMCHTCFQESVHKDHKYKMHTSQGAGYCDCGDQDAWTEGYTCQFHARQELTDGTAAPLPVGLENRLRYLANTILQYVTKLLCWDKDDCLPRMLCDAVEQDHGLSSISGGIAYMTVLYNDETHTYESVIRALELFINCSKDQAMIIATMVDREGRSTVKTGSKSECEKVKSDIQRRTSREINRRTEKSGPLDVKVMDGRLYVHQNHALALLTWINNQIEEFPVLCGLVGEIVLNTITEPEPRSDDDMQVDDDLPLVDVLMRFDRKLWKSARSTVHQMLMKTVLMNLDQKITFAKRFLQHYKFLYDDFIDDDQELDVSVVSLTVQFLTVPTIARILISDDNALVIMIRSLIQHTNQYVEANASEDATKRFNFTQKTFPSVLKRAMHMMVDVHYLLNSIPRTDEWTPALRGAFVDGFSEMIAFLHRMQGMDEVKRQSVEHQVWEQEWETAFNIQLRIQDNLSMFLAWSLTDEEVRLKLMDICLDAIALHPVTRTDDVSPDTDSLVEVNGARATVKSFDVLRGAMSIHQPLWRLLAGLFAVENALPDENIHSDIGGQILRKIRLLKEDIYEQPLRVMVLCAQTSANLWRRNGFSLVNQIHNYYSPLCRIEMFDKDLLMLQVGASLTTPRKFLLHVLNRYKLDKWADESMDSKSSSSVTFGKMEPEETSRVTLTLAEEMLHLLIMLIGERHRPGVGKVTLMEHLNREVLHILCTGQHTFSHISKRISTDPAMERLSLHTAVNNVAEPKKSSSTSAIVFSLKQSLLCEYNPFFAHYSKSDVSLAEQFQHKERGKCERSLQACPPPVPPDFLNFFKPIAGLLHCDVLLKLCIVILERTAKKNRYSSERLLHRALFLIAMGLREQEKDLTFPFIIEAEKLSLMKSIEKIVASEVPTQADLLWWTCEKYKALRSLVESGGVKNVDGAVETTCESPSEAKAKRAALAAKMRAQAMAKMSAMQNSFMKKVDKTDAAGIGNVAIPEIALEKGTHNIPVHDEDEDFVQETTQGFPVCLGSKRSRADSLLPRKVTCILCQEEEELTPHASPFVCAAYVQKSHLFSQGQMSLEHACKVRDFVPAGLHVGIDASTCSHTMHFSCFHDFSEAQLSKERARTRQQLMFSQRMIDPEMGEYLCPLCKRLSNTAMPLLPALQIMNLQGFSSAVKEVNEDFDEWVGRVKDLVETPAVTNTSTKKTHSRKRSHSERSLLDLAKGQADELSQMPLDKDNTLSTSVPSASTMAVLMSDDDAISALTTPLPMSTASSHRALPAAVIDAGRTPPPRQNHPVSPPVPRPQGAGNDEVDRDVLDFQEALAHLMNQAGEQIGMQIEGENVRGAAMAFVAAMGGRPRRMPAADAAAPVAASHSRDASSPVDGSTSSEKGKDVVRAALERLITNLKSVGIPVPPIPKLINLANHAKKFVGPSFEQYEGMMGEFSKFLIGMKTRGHDEKSKEKHMIADLEKSMRGYLSAVAIWQSTSHVVRATAAALEHDRKPLFGALNTRQRDCVLAMSRLSAVSTFSLQHLPEATLQMLRVLLAPPPTTTAVCPTSPRSIDSMYGTSPSSPSPSSVGGYSLGGVDASSPTTSQPAVTPMRAFMASPLAFLLGANSKRNVNINILHVDILSLCISLTMSIGWTWHDGEQSLKQSRSTRELLPDGSIEELHVLRLSLLALHFQVMATFSDCDMGDLDDEVQVSALSERIRFLWQLARPNEPSLVNVDLLISKLNEATLSLLRPMALFYHGITLIPPPEALKDPFVEQMEPLCRYMAVSPTLMEQLCGTAAERLFAMWSNAVPLDPRGRLSLVVQPVKPNKLIDLPVEFSEVIQRASKFKCPSIPTEETPSTVPTLCLVCGQILCSQSYCCQKTVNKEQMGACRHHMSSCSGPMGAFLRIRDCSVILLTTRKRGCFRPAPYVDEFGEADQGFKRGNPLHLNLELYQKLRQLWMHQDIPEEIVNQYEIDHRNIQYDWTHF